MSFTTRETRWACHLCKCTGTGGYQAYKRHYVELHSSLEGERR